MKKLLKTSAFYKYYLISLYEKNRAMMTASYQEQYNFVMANCFAWADFWKKHLEKTGKYAVEEVIINNEYMQKQWAREHGVHYNENNWMESILDAQIAEYKPDIWFSHADVNPEFRLKIRRDHPRIKYIFGYDGTLKHNASFFAGCDLILSCIDDTIKYYEKYGFRGYFLPYAFEKDILDKIQHRNPTHNVSFVGSFYPFKGLHSERLRFIAGLSEKTPIDVYSPAILHKGLMPYMWAVLRLARNKQWKDISYSNYIDSNRKGTAYGLDMYQVLADSKMTLNYHGDIVIKKGGNMRLFEATGAGTCLVTDWKENLSDFFEADKEIVVFKTFDECLEKIRYLLDHEEERKAIAEAGQRRTLSEYSYENVLNKFLIFLESQLK
ncbi:MAG: glycosyltransferase [Ignavibacteriales bacterium]